MSYNNGYGDSGYGRSNPYEQSSQPPRQGQQPPPQRNPYGQRSPFGDDSRARTPPSNNAYGASNNSNPYGSRNTQYGQRNDGYGQRNDQSRQRNDQYGAPRNEQQYGSRNDQYGQRNNQYGARDDGYGSSNDQYGAPRNDQYGTRNDQYGSRNDGYGQRRDDQYGAPRNDQYGSSQGYGRPNDRRNNDVEMSNMPPARQQSPGPQQGYGRQSPYGQQPPPGPNGQRPPNGPPNGPPPSQSYSRPRPQQQQQQQPQQPPSNPSQPPRQQPYGQPPSQEPSEKSYAHTETTLVGSTTEPSAMPGQPGGPNPADPNAILNECSRVDEGIVELNNLLDRLQAAQRKALNDATGGAQSPSVREVDSINTELMATYKSLISRMKWIKSRPESGSPRNQQQIGRVDRSLKATYEKYRVVENDHEKRMREQIERQYRIVKPDASEEEVRAAVEDTNQQIFSQALMRSDRRGESRQVLNAVRDRHEAIQKIESQMIELAELFQQLSETVMEQDVKVMAIEERVVETQTQLEGANVHLDHAVVSARSARKKKWICFWICIILLLVIIAIVVILLAVNHDL